MLNTIFANDVRQTLDHFRHSVDHLFDSFYGADQTSTPRMNTERAWSFSPVLESGWTEQGLNLRAILPGVTEKDVNVTLQNNQLILEGERKTPEAWRKNVYTQLAYGKFYVAVTLPTGLDTDHMNCRLHDGILDIYVPMNEAAKPKQIQILTGEERKAINA